jgi:mono/diheme cytochrome c family protein
MMSRLVRAVVLRLAAALLVTVLAGAALPALARAQGDPQRGREVFEQNCAMCHGQDASGMMGMHPSLRGAVERLSREGVEVTIRKGRKTTPPMPSFQGRLSDDRIEDVIAYLDTLPAGPRNFGPEGGGMGAMMGGGGGWPEWLGWTLVALLALLIVLVGVLVVRLRAPAQVRSSPIHILEERFARGEIDRDEFETRRRALSGEA